MWTTRLYDLLKLFPHISPFSNCQLHVLLFAAGFELKCPPVAPDFDERLERDFRLLELLLMLLLLVVLEVVVVATDTAGSGCWGSVVT